MSRRPVFLRSAEEDVLVAEQYYWKISERLGQRFMDELDRTIKIILQHPGGFQKTAAGFRQAPLDIFPYVVIYQVVEGQIVIFRLFNTRQDPEVKF